MLDLKNNDLIFRKLLIMTEYRYSLVNEAIRANQNGKQPVDLSAVIQYIITKLEDERIMREIDNELQKIQTQSGPTN